MKARQIVAWRDNYKREGEAHSRNSLLAEEFGLWLQEEREQRAQASIAQIWSNCSMRRLQEHRAAGSQGVVRLSLVDDFALAAEDVQP